MSLNFTLINGATAPFFTQNTVVPPVADGPITQPSIGPNQTFQFSVSGSGTVSATAQVWVSSDGKTWVPYGSSISVSGTTSAAAGFAGNQQWSYYSATLTAISGTRAAAKLTVTG